MINLSTLAIELFLVIIIIKINSFIIIVIVIITVNIIKSIIIKHLVSKSFFSIVLLVPNHYCSFKRNVHVCKSHVFCFLLKDNVGWNNTKLNKEFLKIYTGSDLILLFWIFRIFFQCIFCCKLPFSFFFYTRLVNSCILYLRRLQDCVFFYVWLSCKLLKKCNP